MDEYFEGQFTVVRRFQLGLRTAMPGERVELFDRYLARELLDLGRVDADRETREKVRLACLGPAPGSQRNDVFLPAMGSRGISRRV